MDQFILPLRVEYRRDGAVKRLPKHLSTMLYELGFKRCNRCQWFKPLAMFSSDKSRGDGLSNKCKPCDAVKQKDYLAELDRIDPAKAEARRERLREASVQRRADNPGAEQAYKRTYYQANKDRYRERSRAWAEANPERKREHSARALAKRLEWDPWYQRLADGHKRAKAAGLCAAKFDTWMLRDYWNACGIEHDRDFYTHEPMGEEWHLDHVIPLNDSNSPGHIISNVVPVNAGTNGSKGRGPVADLMRKLGRMPA